MATIEWRTNRDINKLPLPTTEEWQKLFPSAEQPGLYVRVTAGGARSFVVDRNRNGQRIRPTLGPAGSDAMTPRQAVDAARIALGMIAEGRSTAEIKAHLARAENHVPAGAMKFGDLHAEYLRVRAHKLSQRTRRDYTDLLDGPLSGWKQKPLEVIDEKEVERKFLSIPAPSRANYAFRLVRALFNYAEAIRDENDKPIVERNPVRVLSQKRLWHRDDPKREVIKLEQIRPWWKAVKSLSTRATRDNADTVKDWLPFLLLTGLRREEAAKLRWEDVDFAARMFTVPTTKNYEPHSLPLSPFLLAMLRRRHAAAMKLAKNDPRRAWVFPGEVGSLAEPKKLIAKVVALSGVKFSAHTCRRTFASIAESRDLPYLTLKRLLNHKAQDVTGRSYTVIGVERLRKPMQRIEDFILRTAGERRSSRVASIHETRQRKAAKSEDFTENGKVG